MVDEESQAELRRARREIMTWKDKYQASQEDLKHARERGSELLKKLATIDSEKNISTSKAEKLQSALTEKDEELHSKKDLLPEHRVMVEKLQLSIEVFLH